MLQKFTTPVVPEPAGGPYSHCLVTGNTIYVAGQHAGAPNGGLLGDGSPEDQARQTFRKIIALVEAAGATAADIVKVTVFVTDMADRAAIGRARNEFFAEPRPCSTLVQISSLVEPELKVEIEAIAVRRGR